MSMPPVDIPARNSLSRWRQRLMLALLTAGGLSLAGCTVSTASPRVLTTADGQILEVTEDQQGYVTQAPPAPLQETITVRPSVNVIWQPCIDPLNSCTGVIVEGNDDEYPDGRRYQALDGQA